MEGRPHLVLGLVWQLVKMALLSKINLKEHPNLIRLLQADETLDKASKSAAAVGARLGKLQARKCPHAATNLVRQPP